MGDPQDSTELLLQRARERRARNAEAIFNKRERTGHEKLSIADTVRSKIPSADSVTAQPTRPNLAIPHRGVASGVKGTKSTNNVAEIKAVPLAEIEDDFECLQEKMRNRFKNSNQETKENLLSPGSNRHFFDDPNSTPKTPLSPSRMNIISPNKKFFPDVKVEDADEPIPPLRTTSRDEQNHGKNLTSDSNSSLESKTASEVRKYTPVKTNASFRSRVSPVMSDAPNQVNPALSPSAGLKTVPSISIKPNSIVSRALAKLEKKNPDDSEVSDTSASTSDDTCPPTAALETGKTPKTHNTTREDSFFIRNNMAQIQHDLSDMRQSVVKETDENVTDEIMPVEDMSNDVTCVTEYEDEEEKQERGQEQEQEEVRELIEEGGGVGDSLEELCDDVMPSPNKNMCHDQSEDSEWLDLSSEAAVSPRATGNTSLKRDVDCLAESVFSSVESFVSADYNNNKDCRDEVRKALSPTHAPLPAVKKLRRSMSVSDLPKSPSRFVRMDALRSSSSSLKTRSVTVSEDTVSCSSVDSEGKKSRGSNNKHRGPLEEGTLELRPPFDQIKVLEEGIMVQNEVEAQAIQLLEHCQYGLEQVEAEKLQLIAGLKKEVWKYHLSELKDGKDLPSNVELPRGKLEIRDLSLLLRQDYLVNQVIDSKVNQATFVAVKVSPYRVLCTNVATSQCNIHGTNLSLSENIVIDNLPPDFRITLEVYCMSYNMMSNATPAKKKRGDNTSTKSANTPKRLLQSAMSKIGSQKSKPDKVFTSSMEVFNKGLGSPTSLTRSPNSVASSARSGSKFVLAGSVSLTIKDVKKTQFRLRKAPFHSPFEGTINLAMSTKEAITSQPPSHKGFLTIFQEESGLGAWNRRWCSVQDNKIYYWLYPEDEMNQNKEPHGEIDLRKCKNEQVSIASRLDCARPNTFVLILLSAALPGDRTSIITESNGKTTQTKYMLAADSKDERKQWMEVLNKCLQSIHSWNH